MIRENMATVVVVKATENDNATNEYPYWTTTESITLATFLGIMMCVAVVGNIMVITVVAKNRGMRTRTNLFLCNLALADLCCAILDMPISLITIVKGRWIFNSTVCQLNGFAVPFFFVASIHTLMYIGIHKYVSIRYPLGQVLTRRRVRFMIAAAWVWATIAGYLTVHGLNTVTYKAKTTQCGPAYPNNPWTYTHLAFIVITCYIIPLVILALCYVGMFREIKALAIRMEQHTTMEKQLIYVQQQRITLILLMVLVFFVICWTPYIAYSVAVSFIDDKTRMPRLANPISYWCGYLSSACNPLIYGLMSPAFREGYKELLCHVHQEEIVSDGYSYYRRKKRPWSTISVSRNYYTKGNVIAFVLRLNMCNSPTAYQPEGMQPFAQFRNFLHQHFSGLFPDHDSTFGSAPASRKNSFSSFANYVLFQKSRPVSTNSLPRNFSYSVGLPGRSQPNGIAPRLRNILQNQQATYNLQQKPRVMKNPAIEIHVDDVNVDEGTSVRKQSYVFEVSPLLVTPAEIEVTEVPSKPTTLVIAADIEATPKSIMKTPRSSVSSDRRKTSIESGYNDVVFLDLNGENGVRRVSQPVSTVKREDSLFGDMLTVPDETRQWFSKSLSEEGKKSPSDDYSLDKATSDTCILCKNERSRSVTPPTMPPPARISFFKRLFSRSESESKKRKITIEGDSVTSVDDSPKHTRKESTSILKKYFRSVSADPTRSSEYQKRDEGRHLSFGEDHYIPHRSASDPSLLDRKQSRWKKIVDKYSNKKKQRRKSSDDARERSESSSIGRLFRSLSEHPAEIERHPSIEKLDTMNQELLLQSYTGRNYVPKKKMQDRRCISHEVVKNEAVETEVVANDVDSTPEVVVCMYRSASDPNMTFQMIEDKVIQRQETKKWDRERKTSFRRSSNTQLESECTDDTAIDMELTSDFNINNCNSLSESDAPTPFLVLPSEMSDKESVL